MKKIVRNSNTYFLRWGYGHKANDGTPLHDRYAVISASSFKEAKEVATKYWNTKWGDIIDSILEIEKWGLKEIALNYQLRH